MSSLLLEIYKLYHSMLLKKKFYSRFTLLFVQKLSKKCLPLWATNMFVETTNNICCCNFVFVILTYNSLQCKWQNHVDWPFAFDSVCWFDFVQITLFMLFWEFKINCTWSFNLRSLFTIILHKIVLIACIYYGNFSNLYLLLILPHMEKTEQFVH